MESQEPVQRGPLNDKPAPQEEGPVTLRQWVSQNGVTLLIVGALLAFLFYKFDLASLLNILKAFLGLSLVVFIHELGHLMAAKWCDVHVTSFSLGFGPTVPGCSFQWGETTYKLSLIPLGGYVQMVGQIDGDESSDGSEEDPRSFRNKTVGQRMLIISAGVIMNVILAVITFVLVFRGPGKDRLAPVISGIDPSSPSFVQGIRTGSVVKQINSEENPTFEDLMYAVRGSLAGEEIRFVFQRPGHDPVTMDIEPLKKKRENPMIGLRPSSIPEFASKKFLPKQDSPCLVGSTGARATPALDFGDKILAIREARDGAAWHVLRDDPRHPGHGQKDYFQFLALMQDMAGKPIVVKVARTDGEQEREVECTVPPAFSSTLGVRMGMGPITSIRTNSSADKQRIKAGKDGQMGDVIVAVEVADGKGGVKRWGDLAADEGGASSPAETVPLDPETLPHELRDHMARLEAKDKKVKLFLHGRNSGAGPEHIKKHEVLDWDDAWKYDQFILIYKDSPLPIPELGLAYQIKTKVAAVTRPKLGDAANPLEPKDEIKKIRFHYQEQGGEEEPGPWVELFETKDGKDQAINAWANVAEMLRLYAGTVTKVELVVDRDDDSSEDKEIVIVPVEDLTRPTSERGFRLMQDIRNQKASSIFGAIGMGFRDTYRSVNNVITTLRGLVLGRLPIDKNLGGPLRIGEMAYRIAGFDFWEFIFFLGLISINLAVINFLPIPVLDGGHMVLLLYEKFRGKPASEGVRVVATYAGLAIILCLIGLTFFLDFSYYLR